MCNTCNTNGFGRSSCGCGCSSCNSGSGLFNLLSGNGCGCNSCNSCNGWGWSGNGWGFQRICRDCNGNIRVITRNTNGCGCGCNNGCGTSGNVFVFSGNNNGNDDNDNDNGRRRRNTTSRGCVNALTVTDDAYYAQLYGLNRSGSTRCGCSCSNAYMGSTVYTDTVDATTGV